MDKTKILRVLNIIKNVICWALVVCLVSMVIIFLMARTSGETPSIFGYSILRVSSGSMKPQLKVGDIILDKTVDDPQTIKKGDIVTYKGIGNLSGKLVTHKVIKAPYYEDGTLMIQTYGIANEIADVPVKASAVVGIMICKIPFLDILYNVFLSPWGLIILIALIILIFFDEIIAIIKILTGTVEPEEREDINEIIDRLQKEKALETANSAAAEESAAESEQDVTADNNGACEQEAKEDNNATSEEDG